MTLALTACIHSCRRPITARARTIVGINGENEESRQAYKQIHSKGCGGGWAGQQLPASLGAPSPLSRVLFAPHLLTTSPTLATNVNT